ncbi:MAG TPA: chalcone isomerase family protein [Burkholderiales bacterium]
MRLALLLLAMFAATATTAPALQPAACGVRNTLWIEHYSAQLYVPAGASIKALGDPEQPKMLRMRMLNTFLMPPEIPRKWREALQPVLEDDDMKRLQAGYHGLQPGDTVVVSYQPQKGIALSINDRTVLAKGGHDAIDALLAAWADDAPLEKKLAGTASRNRCRSAA